MYAVLSDLMRESFQDPRAATRRVINLQLPRQSWWQALLVIITVSVLLEQLLFWVSFGGVTLPDPETLNVQERQVLSMTRFYAENPLLMVGLQIGLAVIAIYAITIIGRLCGGTGIYDDALAMVTWFQAIILTLQVIQTIVGIVLPPLSGMAAVITLVLHFYLLTMFIAEIHGFERPGMVFMMIGLTILGFAVVFSVLLSLFGVTFMPELPNA